MAISVFWGCQWLAGLRWESKTGGIRNPRPSLHVGAIRGCLQVHDDVWLGTATSGSLPRTLPWLPFKSWSRGEGQWSEGGGLSSWHSTPAWP